MKSLAHIVSGAVVAVLAYGAGASSPVRTSVPQGPIASVDMAKVINDFLEENATFENLRNDKKKKEDALHALLESIQAQREALEIEPRNSPRYLELRMSIEVDQGRAKLTNDMNEAWFAKERGKVIREAYKRAYNIIESYAKEQGILMVMLATEPDLPEAPYDAVQSAIIVRSLVFGSSAVDITADIQKAMKKG